jgi:cell cycle checkpoint protein
MLVLFTMLLYTDMFASYHFKHIAKTMRALQTSTKTSLRIDDEGLLSLQFLMPAPSLKTNREQTAAFTEFRVRQVMILDVIN